MFTLTVYARKNQDGFRVVMGDHEKSAFEAGCTTRVYQHSERDGAVDAALNIEQDASIRAQILRFRSGSATPPSKTQKPSDPARAELVSELGRHRVAHSNRIQLIRTKSRPDVEISKTPGFSSVRASRLVTALLDDISIAQWHRRGAVSIIRALRAA